MNQFIYALAALGAMMVLSVAISNGSRQAVHRIYMNEALTQMTGVAYDVLEDIERQSIAFDKITDESLYPKPIKFPLVRYASELTPEAGFGGCTDFHACADIDDFDGLQVSRTTQGHTFLVDLTVRYVDETTPTEETSSQTFAKRISAKVTHPAIMINGEPLSATISRVVTYHRVTEKTGIWL